MDAPLYALLYQSRAVRTLGAAEVDALVDHASCRNAGSGVTGLLVYGHITRLPDIPGLFLQWLEGSEAVVEEVFARIQRDRRHVDVEVLARGEMNAITGSGARLFPAWAMTARRLADVPATLGGFLDYTREAAAQNVERT